MSLSQSRGTGALRQDNHAVAASGVTGSRGAAVIAAKPSKVIGFGVDTAYGSGDLRLLPASVNGDDLVGGDGALDAAACAILGEGLAELPTLPTATDFPGSYPGTATWRGHTTVWRGHTALPGKVPPPWWSRGAA